MCWEMVAACTALLPLAAICFICAAVDGLVQRTGCRGCVRNPDPRATALVRLGDDVGADEADLEPRALVQAGRRVDAFARRGDGLARKAARRTWTDAARFTSSAALALNPDFKKPLIPLKAEHPDPAGKPTTKMRILLLAVEQGQKCPALYSK
jgi:hypothetical protein